MLKANCTGFPMRESAPETAVAVGGGAAGEAGNSSNNGSKNHARTLTFCLQMAMGGVLSMSSMVGQFTKPIWDFQQLQSAN